MLKKLAPNRMQLYLLQISGSSNFQTQPIDQTAQFWSRASVQVSGTSFLSVCHTVTPTSHVSKLTSTNKLTNNEAFGLRPVPSMPLKLN